MAAAAAARRIEAGCAAAFQERGRVAACRWAAAGAHADSLRVLRYGAGLDTPAVVLPPLYVSCAAANLPRHLLFVINLHVSPGRFAVLAGLRVANLLLFLTFPGTLAGTAR